MASLEERNEKYRIIFRFGGEKFSRSLNTTDRRNAQHMLAQLEDNLRRLELGTLALEPGVDIPTLLLSSGASSQRPKVTKAPLLGQLLDRYLNSIPIGSMEQSTIGMLNTHVRHLNRLMGVRTRLESVSLERLQSYVNDRSLETGIRGRMVSPVTIKKELSTLQTAWNWAMENRMVAEALPNKSRLRFPKQDEKPPFKTWSEIKRLIKRAGLTEHEARDYWDCVYLNQIEIEDLLVDAESSQLSSFIHPMFATAAYTGARRSALLRSQIEDVDLESGHMVIREKKRIKGQRSTRSVPIAPRLALILTNWFDIHPGGCYTFSLTGDALSRDQAHDYFSRTVAGVLVQRVCAFEFG